MLVERLHPKVANWRSRPIPVACQLEKQTSPVPVEVQTGIDAENATAGFGKKPKPVYLEILAARVGLLNHACRLQQHTSRQDHSKCASGSKVDDEVVHIGLLDGDVCRIRATQNPIYEFSGASEQVRNVRSVRQQASGIGLS